MTYRYRIVVLIVLLSLFCASGVLAQDEWTGNVNAFLGQKKLDSADWEPVDEQPEFGIEIDFRKRNWPISIAIDFMGSSDEETVFDPTLGPVTLEGKTSEFDIGVRKIFDELAPVKPFIGGGISFIRAEATVTAFGGEANESDTGAGIWLDGGLYFTLGQHFNLGFELKYSDADVTIAGINVKAGGTHVGLLAGYHW
ncbi:MAG: outer membrane protein [Betaproteobacteria bacterium]